MSAGGAALRIVFGVFATAGAMMASTITLDMHLGSGANGIVTFTADKGDLFATSAIYTTQFYLGALPTPGGTAQLDTSYQGVMLSDSLLHIWPNENPNFGTGDLYSQFGEFLADTGIGRNADGTQFLFAALTPNNLNGIPALGIAFLRPGDDPNAPFQYLASFVAPAGGWDYGSGGYMGEAPEPSTIALFSLGLAVLVLRGRGWGRA